VADGTPPPGLPGIVERELAAPVTSVRRSFGAQRSLKHRLSIRLAPGGGSGCSLTPCKIRGPGVIEETERAIDGSERVSIFQAGRVVAGVQ
jgi:hypothetical protein